MKHYLLTKTLLLLLILSNGYIFQSCKNESNPSTKELNGLWILKTINGEDAKSVFSGALPTLQFNFIDNMISGTGGCNRYYGKFTYKDGIFSAPLLTSTEMLCASDNQEDQFLLGLSKERSTLALTNDILSISKDEKIILEFEKKIEQENIPIEDNTKLD